MANLPNDPGAPPTEHPSAPEPLVEMFLPATGARAGIPKSKAHIAHQRGWQVDVAPDPEVSQGAAALLGAARGGTSGFLDEIKGAVEGAKALPEAVRQRSTEPVTSAYTHGRDEARSQLAGAQEQWPKTTFATQFAGGAPAAFALPGGIPSQVAQGAVQGLGNTPELSDPAQVVKDVVTSGALSGGPALAFKGVGPSLVAPLENAAGSALLSGAGIKPQALGATKQEAVDVAKQALKEPGLVPPVLGPGATAETLAQNAAKTKAAAGDALSDTYQGLQTGKQAGVNTRVLAQSIFDSGADAALSKPALKPALINAVRQVDPAGYDAAKEAFIQRNGAAAAKQIEQSEPWRFVPVNPMDLSGVQEAMNRLKGLGAYPKGSLPSANQLSAKDSIFTPGWNSGLEALGNEAERLGGPAGRSAVEAARDRYGMNAQVQSAAEGVNRTPETLNPLWQAAKHIGGAAIGASGHGASGALLGGLGAHVADKLYNQVAAPRAGRALQNVADSAAQGLPWLSKLGGAFARMFEGKSPADQLKIDHKLQEISPSYRKVRDDAIREKQNDPSVDPTGRID